MTRKNNLIIIYYDLKCAFCLRSLKILQKVISHEVVDIELKSLESLTHIDLNKASIKPEDRFSNMLVLDTKSDNFYIGFFGFKFILRNYAKNFLLKSLFSINLKLFDFIGSKIYRKVADNRRRFGCNSDSCNIHGK